MKHSILKLITTVPLLIATLCCPSLLIGQVVFDNATSGGFQSSGTTLTFSHTVNDATNGVLIVGAYTRNSGTATVTGVTYNGVAMTLARERREAIFNLVYSSMWYLAAPATGANNVVVTFSATPPNNSGAIAASFTGVDQTTPQDGGADNEATNQESTVTVTSATNDMAVDFTIIVNGNTGPTVGAGQTSRATGNDGGSGDLMGVSTEPGAASNTMTWTWSANDKTWLALGLNLNAAAAATCPKTLRTLGVGC